MSEAGPLFKIYTAAQWAARSEAELPWAPIDEQDGFVHLSARSQVRETASKHFAGQEQLVLVRLSPDRLPELRWEVSRGGALFPHVYGPISTDAVLEVTQLVGDDATELCWPPDL